MTDRKTEVMIVPGLACALCGSQGGPGMHLPVMGADGRAGLPRVCQPCVSVFSAVLLQLLGHAGAQLAAIAVNVNSTGQPQPS